MDTPTGSSRQRPPPTSPPHPLYGLEKAIPPSVCSPSPPFLIPYCSPSPWRSPLSSPFNKPLPEHPESPIYEQSRSSSIYSGDSAKSGDSGYTKIVQSYGERNEEDVPSVNILQPTAYRETIAPVLAKRFSYAVSPEPIATVPRSREQSISFLHLTPNESTERISLESKNVPSFTEFSRNIRERKIELVSPMSSHLSPDFQSLSYGQISSLEQYPLFQPPSFGDYRPAPPSIHEVRAIKDFQQDLMPQPLRLGRSGRAFSDGHHYLQTDNSRRSSQTQRTNLSSAPPASSNLPLSSPYPRQSAPDAKIAKTKKVYRLSTDSFSSDSFTVYNGAREAVRAMIKDKLQKKKNSKAGKTKQIQVQYERTEQRPHARTISFTNIKPSATLQSNTAGLERKFSWVSSPRSSTQNSISGLLRKLSIRVQHPPADDTGRGRTMDRGPSRRRQKQRAIPTTPYQRYGPDIWLAKNKRKRAAHRAEAQKAQKGDTTIHTTLEREQRLRFDHSGSPRHGRGRGRGHGPGRSKAGEITAALQNSRSHLIHVFDGMKGRSASQRRRDQIKKSIVLVGPTVIQDADEEDGKVWL